MPNIVGTWGDRTRLNELRKCQTNLFYLATEYLNFDLLTESFHKPMMDTMDRRRKLFIRGKYHKSQLEIWARDYYKTTVRKAQCVQDFLCDPTDTISWWHAVEDMAVESGVAIGKQLQENNKLRKLRPEIFPSKAWKKFVSSSGFRLPSNNPDDAPSMRMWGAGSEATGGHSKTGYLDDIIGLNTIMDSLMPKVRRWYGSTASNVVRTDIGRFLATGTRWDADDIYSDWIKDPKRWDVRHRACYETDGVPDWKGDPVLYTREQIEAKRSRMSEMEFACQMMNDPIPEGDRLWVKDQCEHFVSLKAATAPGRVFVISDPAPAKAGSWDGRSERERGDGSKDYWAIAVVKLQVRSRRREIVLLDGDCSQDWDPDAGFRRIAQFAKKWNTGLIAVEATGQAVAFYQKSLREACREVGSHCTPIDLDWTYMGKNHYFAELASRARRDEFLIHDRVPQHFLDMGLDQCRRWVRREKGKNGLRFDDVANCWSFAVDPALERLAPVAADISDPFEESELDDSGLEGSRYCGYY